MTDETPLTDTTPPVGYDTPPTEAGIFSLDEDTRIVRGLLVPWDEPTDPRHKHPAIFPRATITVPRDLAVLRANRDHQLTDPVAVFSRVEDTDRGLVVELKIADTDEGDELIQQHREGKYRRLSAEFRNLVKRGQEVVSGVLTGAAFVPAGAFASATLFSLDPIEEAPDDSPEPPETEPIESAETQEEDVSTLDDVATVPGTLAQVAPKKEELFELMPEREDLFALMRRVKEYGDPAAARELAKIGEASMFALSDVKVSGTNQLGTAAIQTGWIGKVWEGDASERIIVPLLTPGILTKLSWAGWKWNAKPTMATWTGNKAALTSAAVTATAVTGSAQRFAGGHDLAREFYDFNETEALEAYAAAMVESYKELSDDYALEKLVDGATALEYDDAAVPADVPAVLAKLVQGALAVVQSGKALPTFAVLSEALYAQYLYTMRDNTLEFLATSANLKEGTLSGMRIVPDPYGELADDQLLVGAKRAAKALELPGSPVRVNALDLVNGGVDQAFFGYIGIQVDRATALQLVSDPASA